MSNLTKFHTLAREWRERTMLTSSASDMAQDPAVQQIVALGEPVIPLVLQELRTNPGWLSVIVLHGITGQNPVPKESAGHLPSITKAWLDWAAERNQDDNAT